MRLRIINMYEYKIFESPSYSIAAMNTMLEELAQKGWEPVQVNVDLMQVLAKRPKTLND